MKELKKSGASKKQAEIKQKTQQKQKNKNKKEQVDDEPKVYFLESVDFHAVNSFFYQKSLHLNGQFTNVDFSKNSIK